jgi:Domain of unknown function (DUF4375)
MAQLPFFRYAGEAPEALFALAASHRIDSLVVAFEDALEEKRSLAGPGALSVVELDVLAVEALEREVNNGGYHQFFVNSSREFACDVVAALTRIGCPGTAAITGRAIAALGGTSLTAADAGGEIVRDDAARDTELDACDSAYYAAGENIAGALFSYLLANRADVRFSA